MNARSKLNNTSSTKSQLQYPLFTVEKCCHFPSAASNEKLYSLKCLFGWNLFAQLFSYCRWCLCLSKLIPTFHIPSPWRLLKLAWISRIPLKDYNLVVYISFHSKLSTQWNAWWRYCIPFSRERKVFQLNLEKFLVPLRIVNQFTLPQNRQAMIT